MIVIQIIERIITSAKFAFMISCCWFVIVGEPRIVAPNVGKLSHLSVVELKLQSVNECVTVQCSVDVLKM